MKPVLTATLLLGAASLFATPAIAQNSAPEVDEKIEKRRFVIREHVADFPTLRIQDGSWLARVDHTVPASLNLFSSELFPAEFVLGRADEIELTQTQRRRIIDIAAESEAKLTRQRLENRGQEGRLDNLLQQSPIDADAALAELDRLLEAERGPKREQLARLIAVRNVLTQSQTEKLKDWRADSSLEGLFARIGTEEASEE